MSRSRIEVPQLENMVGGKKKFVRYAEGASLYSLGLHTFQEIAKEANVVYKVKRCVLVNTEKWMNIWKISVRAKTKKSIEIQISP